jgi:LacI family transcriptional regulator
MPVSIREVARRLNLSITTVSRALDGYSDVAQETRQRVIQAAQEMGYVPNRAARQLRKQRAETIGYIQPTTVPRFSDPFYSDFIAGLGDEVARNNYDLLISSAPPAEESERLVYQRWVRSRKVDGYVLNRLRLHDWRIQYLVQMRIPFVTLERTLDDVDYPSVEVDGQAGIKALVEYLITQGHSRIAYIGASPELTIQAQRYSGFSQGLQEMGVVNQPGLVTEGDLTHQGGYQAAQKLLSSSNPPTAIVCINDVTAIGAIRGAAEQGLIVGRDVAISGFDGIEEGEHTQPSLTTLKQPVYEIAQELVKILLAEIDGIPLASRRIQLQPELILRASTG